MNMKYIIAAVIIIVVGGVAGAMYFGNTSSISERSANTLVCAVGTHGGEPEAGFDPIMGWSSEMGTQSLIQSTLFKKDHNLTFQNDLATNYTTSPDLKQWNVTIRPDVKFSDNTSLTAKDVAFTYNKAKESGAACDLSSMNNATAINKTTVQFNLNETDSTFKDKLCDVGIVPSATYNNETYGSNPIGSGPYKLVQWDKGQQTILELNDNYYGEKPQFDKITLVWMKNEDALAAAQKGEVDIAEVPLNYANQSVDNMTNVMLNSVDIRYISLPVQNDTGQVNPDGQHLGNNVTADPAIRQALNYGVNRSSIISGALYGHGTPAYSTVGQQLPWYNPDVNISDGDVAKAKQILADNGWKDTDGDGIVEKNGVKAEVDLYYSSDDPVRQAIAVSTQEQAKKIGIQFNPVGASWDEIDNYKFNSSVVWGGGSSDPDTVYTQYYSELAGQGYDNPSLVNNSVSDKYMLEAKNTTDVSQSYALWEKAIWDGSNGVSVQGDAPILAIAEIPYSYFVDNNLDISQNTETIQPHGGDIFGNIQDWHRVNQTNINTTNSTNSTS